MKQQVTRVYVVNVGFNDTGLAFSTLKGAVDFLDAYGIGEDDRRMHLKEMPLFGGFHPIYSGEVSDG